MQWVMLVLPNVRPIVIVNVHRPPQGDYKKGCPLIMDAFLEAEPKDRLLWLEADLALSIHISRFLNLLNILEILILFDIFNFYFSAKDISPNN